MEHEPIVIVLELEQRDGSLSGRITRRDGLPTTFNGWLGLTAGLDALLQEGAVSEQRDKDTHSEGDLS